MKLINHLIDTFLFSLGSVLFVLGIAVWVLAQPVVLIFNNFKPIHSNNSNK